MKPTKDEIIAELEQKAYEAKLAYLVTHGEMCAMQNEQNGMIVTAYEVHGAYFESKSLVRLGADWLQIPHYPVWVLWAAVLGLIAVGSVFAAIEAYV